MAKDKKPTSDKDFVNLKEWQAAGDILNRAIDLVNKNGWQQGEILPSSKVCLTTAIERAWQEKKYSLVDFNYAREALSKTLKVPREPPSLSLQTHWRFRTGAGILWNGMMFPGEPRTK